MPSLARQGAIDGLGFLGLNCIIVSTSTFSTYILSRLPSRCSSTPSTGQVHHEVPSTSHRESCESCALLLDTSIRLTSRLGQYIDTASLPKAASPQSSDYPFSFRMMLPGVLAGSYNRYKEDTTVFTTWLTKAAIACGYRPSKTVHQDETKPKKQENQGSSSRLKGRARKEAKAAAGASKSSPKAVEPSQAVIKYEVTTQELLKQANAIAASKKVKTQIPERIVRVVQRAINARKRCAAWFQKTGAHDEDGSTARHLHFVDILEKALSALHPPGASDPAPLKAKDTLSTPEEQSQEVVNRFSALDVEDLDESPGIAASDVIVANKKSVKGRTIDVYELEGQSEIDHAFVIFCFFEDLHRLQDTLKET